MATCTEQADIITSTCDSQRIKGVLLALAGAAFLLTACDRPNGKDASQSAAAAGKPVEVLIDNVGLGTALGPHGGIARGAADDLFETGKLIYVAMELKQAPVGTEVHVTWHGPANDVIGKEAKRVMRGQRFMHFAADSGGIPAGDNYHVELSVNGKRFSRLKFKLILGSS